MKSEQTGNAFSQLITELTPRYGSGEAHSIARIVFEDVFQTQNPLAFHLNPEQKAQFMEIRQRLLNGEPVQYVLGQADFFGLKFKVNPAVLIPRQETEELVAWALGWLRENKKPNPAILDIGLGSGCIGISLKIKYKAVSLYGLEKSPEALKLATENALELLGSGQFEFQQADILSRSCWPAFASFDLIISNPPYIPYSERNLMPEHVLAHEPPLALFVDDPDPLVFYRIIVEFSLEKLSPGGALFFECNEFNAGSVVELLSQAGFEQLELRKDLSGADRMVKGQLPLRHV